MGVEFSGVIEQFGPDGHEDFKIGDEVLGLAYGGAYAEYIAVSTKMLIHKPKELSWEEAAGVPEVSRSNLAMANGHSIPKDLILTSPRLGLRPHRPCIRLVISNPDNPSFGTQVLHLFPSPAFNSPRLQAQVPSTPLPDPKRRSTSWSKSSVSPRPSITRPRTGPRRSKKLRVVLV